MMTTIKVWTPLLYEWGSSMVSIHRKRLVFKMWKNAFAEQVDKPDMFELFAAQIFDFDIFYRDVPDS